MRAKFPAQTFQFEEIVLPSQILQKLNHLARFKPKQSETYQISGLQTFIAKYIRKYENSDLQFLFYCVAIVAFLRY